LRAVVATPGLTAFDDLEAARTMLLEDALRALPLLRDHDGTVVDAGTGGGSPGLPLALALPERAFTLVEAERRKAEFLRGHAPPNAAVVWGRVEEQPVDAYGVALAKALAQPATAVEWVVPLVAPGGVAVFWFGPTADLEAAAAVSARVGGGEPRVEEGLVVVSKVAPTPAGFPRRVGVARKRPLA
jgi:16S rRNA (guanine527-N7)-methyltransferase